MKIEVSTVALVPYYGLLDAMKACANLGFATFELPGDRPHAWPRDLRSYERRLIRRYLENNQFEAEIISIDGSYLLGPGLCSEDENVRNDIFTYIKDLIELGSDLGCSKFIMVPGRPLITTPKAKGRELAVRSLGECTDFAKEYRMTVCIENSPHPTGYLDTPENLMSMVQDVSATNLAVRLDPCHCNVSKTDFTEFCNTFKGKIASVGLHDNMGDADSHLPIGLGNVKHLPAIQSLRKVGYDGSLTIEILPFEGWRVEKVEAYLTQSKKIVENLLADPMQRD
ncbi:MAG TPA: sugar phosphate isomerase/epimerase [Nitrososphaerales archaeon]|nr:sugar phosphate isomerase/epimerase [Nitrososphaerales archaeon]